MIRTQAIRQLADGLSGGDPADADLLARFTHGDAGAFELLVWRHAALVLRTCRAVLRDRHAAEDAAQATFLALARQAATVGHTGTVAGWLFRVARRVAGRSRKQIRTVDADPDQVAAKEHADPNAEAVAVLHEELARLPDRYRLPVLLCFFEGHSHAEAARSLGWPVGTVAGRVARAKSKLELALTRRGVAPALLVPAVAVPPAFARDTARFATRDASPAPSVLALARQEVRMTTAAKLARAAALVTACAAASFGALWASQPQPPAGQKAPAPRPAGPLTPVVEAGYAIAPVTTALQRRLLQPLAHGNEVAVVYVNGAAVAPRGKPPDIETLNIRALRHSLNAYVPSKEKSLSVVVTYGARTQEFNDAAEVLRYALDGLARDLGFGNSLVRESYSPPFDWAKKVAPLRENKGTDLDEPAVGDDRVKAYAVRTPLSRVLVPLCDGVVDVRVRLDATQEAWVSAELDASVSAAMKALRLPKGGKVMFYFNVRGAHTEDDRTRERLHGQEKLWLDKFGLEVGSASRVIFTR